MESTRGTVAELVMQGWNDHRTGLWFEGRSLTRHEVAAGAAARAALFTDLLEPGDRPHLGVLRHNTPEYPLWLSAAALAGAAVAGINPTRGGAEWARDLLHTECRVLVTEQAFRPLLDGLDLPGVRVLVTDTDDCADLLAGYEGAEPDDRATPADRLLLYFTSGSTGAPKAAICTQGRLAAAGRSLVRHLGLGADDVHYICMPMFHGNAVIADWAPALVSGAAIALRRRFSASGFLEDVRACGATYFTYVGRAVSCVLATKERPDDRDNPPAAGLRHGGRRGGRRRLRAALRGAARGGLRLVGGRRAVQRTAGTPAGAIGRAAPGDDLAVVDPVTREECPPAVITGDGRLMNGNDAIGELVNRGPHHFEGYWRNPAADTARRREGWYWTGDLFYRDADGFLYFAGRTDDRLRVDSENLAAAMIEGILARYRGALSVAVYAVPDPVAGDQVMAVMALDDAASFDPGVFAAFLAAQPDLGTKMAPPFVRLVEVMPVTATNKIHRVGLRREGFRCADPVWWRPPGESGYRRLTDEDVAGLVAEYRARGREELLPPAVVRPAVRDRRP
ncbi:AMP-binding protein [Streptomyces sp. MI02-2A]|uniref:AMP-binding protein n=1 Tax=unclassified Streptomyces TaxID=2593676 RepID=UPI0029AFC7A6|nr:AMP-binding protein [Streptomyces sp. MI02-2A]MDX3262518.1 AMP-binding protein [Streptomyces sp. MI02-2A]